MTVTWPEKLGCLLGTTVLMLITNSYSAIYIEEHLIRSEDKHLENIFIDKRKSDFESGITFVETADLVGF